jgi:hypothetical protein
VRRAVVRVELPSNAKVADLDRVFGRQKEVAGLDVPVQDAVCVKISGTNRRVKASGEIFMLKKKENRKPQSKTCFAGPAHNVVLGQLLKIAKEEHKEEKIKMTIPFKERV